MSLRVLHRLADMSFRFCMHFKHFTVPIRESIINRRVNALHNGLIYLNSHSKRTFHATIPLAKKVRIGCASGFWGDSTVAAEQLIHLGKLNYLVLDYLSEITMSLLTLAKKKNKDSGYAPDLIDTLILPFCHTIKESGLKIITNAGGINPIACANAVKKAALSKNIDLKVKVITGDDLLHLKSSFIEREMRDFRSGEMFPESTNSITAYFGAEPIVAALQSSADVIITGRCVDSALTLAPLLHEFNWSRDDYDKLAAGSLAGHLVECGAQVTGGNFTDWRSVTNWENIGFPIVEVDETGKFCVCKPNNTGGLVNTATVAEQLLYEIHDTGNYILPDVVCDFNEVTLEEAYSDLGELGVKVVGAKGRPPTNSLKICATYFDGYRTTAVFCVTGPSSVEKGRKTADAILKRVRGIYKKLGYADFSSTCLQVFGGEDTYGGNKNQSLKSKEAVVWLAVAHSDKNALELFSKEIAPAGTGMAPGLTAIVGGRPKVSPVFKLFSFLLAKREVKAVVVSEDGSTRELDISNPSDSSEVFPEYSLKNCKEFPEPELAKTGCTRRLEELAYTRSGDKGNDCNIAVIARDRNNFPLLKAKLTVPVVEAYFEHLWDSDVRKTAASKGHALVERYEVPGIGALNFVLRDVLGGGGIASLRTDPQGKAMGQMLLDIRLEDV